MPRQQKNDSPEALAAPEHRKSLFDRLAGYLDANNWRYESVPEKSYIDMRAGIQDTTVRMIFDVYEADDWQRLLVYAIYPVRVPENKRATMLDAINRINFRQIYGSLEMDSGDGELRVRTVAEAECELAEPMMERAFHAALNVANRNFAPLMAIAFGNADPASVLDLGSRDQGGTVQ